MTIDILVSPLWIYQKTSGENEEGKRKLEGPTVKLFYAAFLQIISRQLANSRWVANNRLCSKSLVS
jgi:hypothetical protein